MIHSREMAASSVLLVQMPASNAIAHINNKSRLPASFISPPLILLSLPRDCTQDRCDSSSRQHQVGASRWKSIMSTTIITIIIITITPTLFRQVYLQIPRQTMSL